MFGVDRPIEIALAVVKIGEKIGGRRYQILTPNELDLSFLAQNNCGKFHQIRFKIATTGEMTDTQIDRQTPAIL